ncbi:MAG TPA: cytochrome b [Rhodanobacteraceae bacterium]|jgi:cytochrome b561|nr:cytochrome b [Rhodanobacteraceae bacterium]
MVTSPQARYTRTAIFLHWLIFALLIAQYTIGWTMPHIGRNTPVTTLISLHFSIGVLIVGVIVVRLVWRIVRGEPAPEAGVPPWQVYSARVIHWLLYLLLVVVPILGWINASYRGMPVTFFELVQMPQLVATRAAGWGWTGDIHMLIAEYGILPLVGLHVAAALYHYFIRRDRVLQRMLPGA